MKQILDLVSNMQLYIILGLCACVIILFIIILFLFKELSKTEKRYNKIMKDGKNKGLEQTIINYYSKIEECQDKMNNIDETFNEIDERLKHCIQKVSIVRYKAFDDIGSDLSFSVALLNEKNDGVIMTSIYGREESTIYAKPIDRGISRYDLSDEEMEVLNNAMENSK